MEELHSSTEKEEEKFDEPCSNRCTPVTRQQSTNQLIRKRLKKERGWKRCVPQSQALHVPC